MLLLFAAVLRKTGSAHCYLRISVIVRIIIYGMSHMHTGLNMARYL